MIWHPRQAFDFDACSYAFPFFVKYVECHRSIRWIDILSKRTIVVHGQYIYFSYLNGSSRLTVFTILSILTVCTTQEFPEVSHGILVRIPHASWIVWVGRFPSCNFFFPKFIRALAVFAVCARFAVLAILAVSRLAGVLPVDEPVAIVTDGNFGRLAIFAQSRFARIVAVNKPVAIVTNSHSRSFSVLAI